MMMLMAVFAAYLLGTFTNPFALCAALVAFICARSQRHDWRTMSLTLLLLFGAEQLLIGLYRHQYKFDVLYFLAFIAPSVAAYGVSRTLRRRKQ